MRLTHTKWESERGKHGNHVITEIGFDSVGDALAAAQRGRRTICIAYVYASPFQAFAKQATKQRERERENEQAVIYFHFRFGFVGYTTRKREVHFSLECVCPSDLELEKTLGELKIQAD